MRITETIAETRAICDSARMAGQRVGLVPTMGFFHAGHRSLMEIARAENDVVVVSLFVNPTQFAPTEDLADYPRDFVGDSQLASAAAVDVLFLPAVAEMYPDGATRTTVHVAGLSAGMCGASRPTHFDGVTTVVAKLFSIVGPSRAYFGRKDFQQLAVVRRMTADLDLAVEVVGCPLVRESDGLAMSSRNDYLTAPERAAAPALHAALLHGVGALEAGERSTPAVVATIREYLSRQPLLVVEYIEIRDAETLDVLEPIDGECVIGLAARVGRARLIDNVVVTVVGGRVTADVGVRMS